MKSSFLHAGLPFSTNANPSKSGPKADKAGTKTSAKTGPSAEAPASGEIEIEARFPLIEAINALGGRDVLLSATDLELITTKFPKATANVSNKSYTHTIQA